MDAAETVPDTSRGTAKVSVKRRTRTFVPADLPAEPDSKILLHRVSVQRCGMRRRRGNDVGDDR